MLPLCRIAGRLLPPLPVHSLLPLETAAVWMSSAASSPREAFQSLSGLGAAICEHVLPAVLSVRTACTGTLGTAFFLQPSCLVSTAHVLPCADLLPLSQLVDHQSRSASLAPKRSWRRAYPDASVAATVPDLVLIEVDPKHRPGFKPVCLTTAFPAGGGGGGGSGGGGCGDTHGEVLTFYLDVASDVENAGVGFKQLRRAWGEGGGDACPVEYVQEDGSVPAEGCSGTPVLEARVSSSAGGAIQWQFRAVGVLYARCPHVDGSMAVCAVPITADLVRDMPADDASLSSLSASSSSSPSAAVISPRLVRFDLAPQSNRLLLPDGLEKLWYQTILPVRDSLLIESVRAEQLRSHAAKFAAVPSVSLADLTSDFDAFLASIPHADDSSHSLHLAVSDALWRSPAKHFRVEITGSTKAGWMLDLRDTFDSTSGAASPASPVDPQSDLKAKFLSSVFARIRVPPGLNQIQSSQLAPLWKSSTLNEEAAIYAQSASSLSSVGKGGQSSIKAGSGVNSVTSGASSVKAGSGGMFPAAAQMTDREKRTAAVQARQRKIEEAWN